MIDRVATDSQRQRPQPAFGQADLVRIAAINTLAFTHGFPLVPDEAIGTWEKWRMYQASGWSMV